MHHPTSATMQLSGTPRSRHMNLRRTIHNNPASGNACAHRRAWELRRYNACTEIILLAARYASCHPCEALSIASVWLERVQRSLYTDVSSRACLRRWLLMKSWCEGCLDRCGPDFEMLPRMYFGIFGNCLWNNKVNKVITFKNKHFMNIHFTN